MHTLGPAHPCAYRGTPVCKAACTPVCKAACTPVYKQHMHTPAKNKKSPKCPYFKGLSGKCTLMRLSHKPTDHREHIVHIDGVTGSSPVATTTKPRRHKAFEVFSVSWTSALLPVGGPDRHTISFYQLRSFTNIQNFECAVSFSMLTGWSPISFTRVDVNGSPASM